MKAVHKIVGAGSYLCGVGRRFVSQDITGTRGDARVTCKTCLKLTEKGGR